MFSSAATGEPGLAASASKPGRRLEDGVAVAHPALLLGRQPGEQPPAVAGQRELGAAELARLGALDPAAELEHHRLHPVTDAEHRDPELEQLAAQPRRALGVDRRRAAGEHQRARRPLADLLERQVVREAARRRRRTRGSAARSAASTGRRSRAPGPPRARSRAARPRSPRGPGLGRQRRVAHDRPADRPRPHRALGLTAGGGAGSLIRDGDSVRDRARPFEPMPTACWRCSACPRSAAPARPSPRRAGSRGCPRSRRSPSRSAARPSG